MTIKTTSTLPPEESWEKPLIEKLAAIEHERWADWQKYLHSRGIEESQGEGYLCLPMGLVKNWTRQIETPYEKLSEYEKQSDRDQAVRYFHLISSEREKAVLKGERNRIIAQLRKG